MALLFLFPLSVLRFTFTNTTEKDLRTTAPHCRLIWETLVLRKHSNFTPVM